MTRGEIANLTSAIIARLRFGSPSEITLRKIAADIGCDVPRRAISEDAGKPFTVNRTINQE